MILNKYIKSMAYAIAGISFAFRNHVNMRFHVMMAVFVILASILLGISALEWCIILLCIGSVLAAELINTSVEVSVDLTTPGFNEKAGHVKDLAAAAVLIISIVSAFIGAIVFLPKILQLINS